MQKHPAELIMATANAIMKNFIPKDEKETAFSFHFTIPPASNYKVKYQKDGKGNWDFLGFEIDEKL